MKKIIDIIAPSGFFSAELLPQISHFLAEQGYIARIPENILGVDALCANTDAVRFELLKQALYCEDSDFIWCVRGGYGATPLLSGLKDLTPPKLKKNLVGFSDITALHLFLSQQWGWQTTHGASIRQLIERDISEQSLSLNAALLEGEMQVAEKIIPLNAAAQQANLSGTLTGGNLKLVESSLGTFWQIQAAHKILMLEEVGELTYRIARSMVHLEQSGVFSQIQALVLGDFSYTNSPAEEVKIQAWLDAFAQKQKFPVFRTLFFGHGKENCPWGYRPAKIEHQQLIQSL